jgi:hypothetical protein
MNNLKTALYQMLTIRNHVASEARIRAAHTVRTASPPDSDTKKPAECMGFSASGCFMRVGFQADEIGKQKGLRFPEAL